jgi:hypothetical protein
MANAAKMALRTPVRALIVGYPGSAKTGAIASLANMGYKIRMLDFDGNSEPLVQFTKPEFRKNIDIVTLEDKLRNGAKFIETAGIPTAFSDGLKLLDEWKYTDIDGEDVNLGRSKDWGCDTIVVLDSLTAMGAASFRRVMNMMNKTPTNTTQQVWGIAMQEQEAFIEKLTSNRNRHHVIVLSHLKMISPKDIKQGDEELNKEIKQQIADLIPARYYPSALGQQLPQLIGQHFPTVIQAESLFTAGKQKRVLRTVSKPELDLKVPSLTDLDKVAIEDGMAKIFAAIAPPIGGCTAEVKPDQA